MSRLSPLSFSLQLVALGVLFGCTSLAGCAALPGGPDCPAVSNPANGLPLLWRAQRDAGAVYLLGSVHFGTGIPRLGEDVEAAFAAADELVVEIGFDDPRIDELLLSQARIQESKTLRDLLSARTAERLAIWLDVRGRNFESIEQYEPWFVTNLVIRLQMRENGYGPEHGIDRHLAVRAQTRMDVVALETAEEQVALFDALPPGLQVAMLEDALERSGKFATSTDQMIDAWQRGDEARLEQLVFAPVKANPEFAPFYDALFDRRNAVMSRRLIEMSSDGKTRLVVLGAGHMLGTHGIPALLCEAGFSVQRISGS